MKEKTGYWVSKVLGIHKSTVYAWIKKGMWEGLHPYWIITWGEEEIRIDKEVVMVATTFLCDWLRSRRYPSKVYIKASQLLIDGLNHLREGLTLYMVIGEKGDDGKLDFFTTREEPQIIKSPYLTDFFLLNVSQWLVELQEVYQRDSLSNLREQFEKLLKVA